MNVIIKNIPNSLTLANLSCGLIAIIFTFQADFSSATICVIIGLLFDFLDGLVARILNVRSEIGKQLDSMSDLITFGLAPAFMMFHFMYYLQNNIVFKFSIENEIFIPALIALTIPICSALRLAKFNIDTNQEKSFIGLPTPALAIFFIAIPHINFDVFPMFTDLNFLRIIIIIMSLLLISHLPLFSFKINLQEKVKSQTNFFRITLFLSSIALFFTFKFAALPFIVILYIILSVINNIIKK